MVQKARLRKNRDEKPRSLGLNLVGPAVILLAAGIAIWPLLLTGPSCGGDFYFHFVSWSEAQRSMLQGVLYPHWANSPNFGVGEPRFVYYPPLTWMVGALMGLVLPWKGVALALAFLLLSATGLANRALAREVLEDGPATLAGCAAIFLGRTISDISQRCDYAELTGGLWIPLLLLFLLRNRNPFGRFWERAFDGSATPLALVVTGIWLSNGPLGIEANYLLAATALVSAALQKSLAPLVRATVGVTLGMGLTSVYLVPAVWERNWARLQDAVTEAGYRIEDGWIFARSANPVFANHDKTLETISVIAVVMFAITLASAMIAWKRGTVPRNRGWWIPLALIPPAVFFLQIPASRPIWNSLPALRLVQFPWRWLLVMQSPLAVFFAAAVWVGPQRRRIPVLVGCSVLFLAMGTAAWAFSFNDCQQFDSRLKGWQEAGAAYGKPEYSPPAAQYRYVLPDVPANCVISNLGALRDISGDAGDGLQAVRPESESPCKGKFSEVLNKPERKGFIGEADQDGYLVLRLRSFPAWAATVNGHATSAVMEQGHGLLAVPVTRGPVIVLVEWTTTPDVVIGRWLSALSLVLLSALNLLERKCTFHPMAFLKRLTARLAWRGSAP